MGTAVTLSRRTRCVIDKANNMITLTAIVLALGLGWTVIELWNAAAEEPASEAPAATGTAKQG